ncbi:MAG: DUF4129 domain-containing protein [Nocardioides sp.]
MIVDDGPPLDPSPDQAREWLIFELSKPRYDKPGVWERLNDAFSRLLEKLITRGGEINWVITSAMLAVFAFLLIGLLLLLSRTRRTRRKARSTESPVLAEGLSARDYRSRAEAAFAAGDFAACVVDAFRALTAAAVEQGRIDDRPASTAHEVVVALTQLAPDSAAEITTMGDLFDQAAYGERPITAAEARRALDTALPAAGASVGASR